MLRFHKQLSQGTVGTVSSRGRDWSCSLLPAPIHRCSAHTGDGWPMCFALARSDRLPSEAGSIYALNTSFQGAFLCQARSQPQEAPRRKGCVPGVFMVQQIQPEQIQDEAPRAKDPWEVREGGDSLQNGDEGRRWRLRWL